MKKTEKLIKTSQKEPIVATKINQFSAKSSTNKRLPLIPLNQYNKEKKNKTPSTVLNTINQVSKLTKKLENFKNHSNKKFLNTLQFTTENHLKEGDLSLISNISGEMYKRENLGNLSHCSPPHKYKNHSQNDLVLSKLNKLKSLENNKNSSANSSYQRIKDNSDDVMKYVSTISKFKSLISNNSDMFCLIKSNSFFEEKVKNDLDTNLSTEYLLMKVQNIFQNIDLLFIEISDFNKNSYSTIETDSVSSHSLINFQELDSNINLIKSNSEQRISVYQRLFKISKDNFEDLKEIIIEGFNQEDEKTENKKFKIRNHTSTITSPNSANKRKSKKRIQSQNNYNVNLNLNLNIATNTSIDNIQEVSLADEKTIMNNDNLKKFDDDEDNDYEEFENEQSQFINENIEVKMIPDSKIFGVKKLNNEGKIKEIFNLSNKKRKHYKSYSQEINFKKNLNEIIEGKRLSKNTKEKEKFMKFNSEYKKEKNVENKIKIAAECMIF